MYYTVQHSLVVFPSVPVSVIGLSIRGSDVIVILELSIVILVLDHTLFQPNLGE